MADLTGQTVAKTYKDLLQVANANAGIDGTLRLISDGEGTDSAVKISSGALSVDNIQIDGNVISSTDTNGNITLTPNGTGNVDAGTAEFITGGVFRIDVDGTAINADGSITFGAGNDAGLFFDGTDLIMHTDGAGASGIILDSEDDTLEFKASGVLQATLDLDGIDLITGNDYQINGTSVLNNNTLGTGVLTSSLTSVGTIATGTWEGTTVAVDQGGTGATTLGDGFVLLGSGTGAITALDATVKGKLIVGDGTTDPIALAVGSNNQVLTADSAETSGIKWAAAAAGADLGTANEWTEIQSFVDTDAGTTNVVRPAILGHNTSGTAAAGFGVGLQFNAEVADGEDLPMAFIDAVSIDVGAGTEDFDLVFSTATAGAAPAEVMRVSSTGVLTLDTALAVGEGGTGATTFTDGAVLLGSGTGAITALDATVKGNLIVGDGTTDPVALAVGTNDQVLTADSTAASGTKWAAAGGGAWSFVSTGTASNSATISFTGLTTDYMYRIVIDNLLPVDDQSHLWLRTSTDNGCNYDSGASDYAHASQLHEMDTAPDTAASTGDDLDSKISLYGAATAANFELGNGTNEESSYVINIINPSQTAFTHVQYTGTYHGSGTLQGYLNGGGFRLSAADVTAVQFLISTGNISTGTFKLYKMAAS